MAKKKNVAPIIINKTPLVPTTIGTLEKKENGPIVTIILILLFAICIFCLPFISSFFENSEIPDYSGNNTPTERPDEPIDKPATDLNYYDIGSQIDLDGYLITNMLLNNEQNSFSLRLVRVSGDAKKFKNGNYYIELYDESLMLLERFKIKNQEVDSFQNLSFPLSNTTLIDNVKKMVIVEKEEKDYPQVSLNKNASDIPYLECSTNDQKITYVFDQNKDEYSLKEINEVYTYQAIDENYENILDEYTTKVSLLEDIEGVEVSLIPIRNGFSYELTLDLNEIVNQTKNRYFSDSIYYSLGTSARTIAFELGASGYSCK